MAQQIAAVLFVSCRGRVKPRPPAPVEMWTIRGAVRWSADPGLVCAERAREDRVVEVKQWAEIRRLRCVRGLSIREIHRRTGLHRETIRRALANDESPVCRRASTGSKLDPFEDEIHALLRADPKLPGQRIRELLVPLGFGGSKTIVDDYLREVRPLFAPPPRTFQRTVYRPGEVCQFDVWQPRCEVPMGMARPARAGSSSPAWATRAPAPARWCSPSRRRTCWPASRVACGSSVVCRGCWSGIARRASTATAGGHRTSSLASAAS